MEGPFSRPLCQSGEAGIGLTGMTIVLVIDPRKPVAWTLGANDWSTVVCDVELPPGRAPLRRYDSARGRSTANLHGRASCDGALPSGPRTTLISRVRTLSESKYSSATSRAARQCRS